MKKIISAFLLFVFMYFQTGLCFAGEVISLHKMENTKSDYVSKKLDIFIMDKDYKVFKKDLSKGEFYFQGKYMGQYTPQFNFVVLIKQKDNDSYIFIKNGYPMSRIRQFLLASVKDQNVKPKKAKDPQLIQELNEEAVMLVHSVKEKYQLFAGTQNTIAKDKDIVEVATTDNTDYTKFVSIETESVQFQSNLNKKLDGYIFKVKNNYTEPLQVQGIEYHNNYNDQEALAKVRRVATPLSHISSVIIGATAIFTFGISYAAMPIALAPVVAENLPVINESKEFLSKKPESEIINSKDSISIRVIALKPSAISKTPYITLKLVNPKTGKTFSVDNEPELLKLYK